LCFRYKCTPIICPFSDWSVCKYPPRPSWIYHFHRLRNGAICWGSDVGKTTTILLYFIHGDQVLFSAGCGTIRQSSE
jgi:hypothetical protein